MAFWNRTPKTNGQPRHEIGVSTLLADYDIVDVNEKGFIVVTEKAETKQLTAVSDVSTTELGYAGTTAYYRTGQDEYNPDLRGWLGLRRWDEMRRSDGTVKGALRLVKTPIYAARWFIEPATNSKQDQKVADHIENCLFEYMTVSWPQLLTEICLHLDFGHYMFEKVFDFQDGKVIWRKFAPRHPLSVYRYDYDDHGGINGVECLSMTQPSGRIYIPIEKLLIFTNEKESGNVEGISVLRSAYKHWYYADNLYKIDAIQKERHGIGVPIIKLPPNFSQADKEAADKLGENLRTNEKAHIVLPPFWDVITLKIEGNQVDALRSAEHHEQRIMASIMADFVQERSGAAAGIKTDLFNKATRFVADQICDVINKWAIPELVDFNWKTVTDYPELKVRRIGETVDWQKISMAIRNMVGAGVLTPDDRLEEWIRDEMDLPAQDPTTKRVVATPQNPGAPAAGPKPSPAGPPKQSQAKNSTQGTTPGSSRIGQPSPRKG